MERVIECVMSCCLLPLFGRLLRGGVFVAARWLPVGSFLDCITACLL